MTTPHALLRNATALATLLCVAAAAVDCGDAASDPFATVAASGTGGGGGQDVGDCVKDQDCADADAICEQGSCIPSHCVDAAQSQEESDVDCGGPCLPCDNGKQCSAAGDCASNFCESEEQSDGPGLCAPCAGHDDCSSAGGTFCEEGVCVGQKVVGESCAFGAECETGYCPSDDGLCCDQRCDSACEACVADKTGLDAGVCGPVLIDTDPDGECGDQGAESCGADGSGCNGDALAPACQVYAEDTPCAPASCQEGELTAARSCDGAGTCSAATPASCSPYACSAGEDACLTSCQDTSECAPTHYCEDTSCVIRKQAGDGCSSDEQCQSGECPGDDLVCCDSACDATCESCLASKTGGSNGICAFVSANTDPDNECSQLASCNGNGACTLL